MSLSVQEFEHLEMEKKEEQLSSEGQFIACRSQGHYYVDLYSFADFFVEVWYVNIEEAFSKEGFREISLLTEIKTISQENEINRYIELYENTRAQ